MGDWEGLTQGQWGEERIKQVDHQRQSIHSSVKAAVRKYNDAAPPRARGGTVVYNHYVPYSRIKDALIKLMKGRKRSEIALDFEALRLSFEIPRMKLLKVEQLNNRHEFHEFINYVFSMICDYPKNIFLGASEGDIQGRMIDIPIGGSPKLHERLQTAADDFRTYLGIDVRDESTLTDAVAKVKWDPVLSDDGEWEN